MKIRYLLPLIASCQIFNNYSTAFLSPINGTPLHEAVMTKNNINGVKELISKGADVNARDDIGATPLHYAAYTGDTGIVRDLLNTPGILVNAPDNEGNTPLHYAVEYLNPTVVREFLMAPSININLMNASGETPEQRARTINDVTLIELFNQYHLAQQQARDQAFAFTLARHPRLGSVSKAAVMDEALFKQIKQELEYQAIREALMHVPMPYQEQ